MKIKGIVTLAAVILTAKLGRIEYLGHTETYYNLNMNRIVERADQHFGIDGVYAVREDGVKTYNGLVIVATDWNVYPFGSLVETSRGVGVVLDTGEFTGNVVDLAVSW